MVIKIRSREPPDANCSTKISDASSSSNEQVKTHLRDPTKPEGEACNADGTLKDASKLEWPESPSERTEPNPLDTDGVWDYWNLREKDTPTSTVSKTISALS